ncbi:long-chain fatty acid--CoA ligase [Parafrankia sp. EUN1f]|uniref:AMP-dependent synthetase/ligase n=1 Tax=Parafrankia sp. EUN1f TaxID=102897 RepID=UPI0001C43F01|nr:AMP-binding protein [Parafrankia sp. EUN1f]EFC83488.1 AMP-dependent synthetase and ligase [Parafrankia sp. EUN1f]
MTSTTASEGTVRSARGAPLKAMTLPEAFQRTVATHPDKVGIRTIGGGVELTWAEFGDRVRSLAGSLAKIGCRRGERVAVLMRNLVENHLVDYAFSHLGAVPFGIFNSSSLDQIVFQIGHAEAEIVVTEARYLDKVAQAVARLGDQVRHIVVADPDGEGPALTGNQISFAEVEATPNDEFDVDASWQAIDPEDIACIIYTSGTTGQPKAAIWSHRMIVEGLRAIDAAIPLPRRGLISFLPMAHAGGRNNSHHYALAYGATITVCPEMNDVSAALVDVHPDLFSSSPRVYEKLQAAIESLIEAEPDDSRRALKDALQLGLRLSHAEDAGSAETVADLAQLRERREQSVKLFRPILAKVGLDQLDVVIIGGATVAPELVHFFRAIGTPMLEAYGATEVMLNIFNRVDDFKTGSAGKALPGVELRIADDGELFCRGPLNFSGYFKDAEKTVEVIDADGWVGTGDIARIDDEGFVWVVDRKKEIIINSHGKNMSPAVIETAILEESSLIAQFVAIGESRRYVTGVATLDPVALQTFIDQRPEMAGRSPQDVIDHELIQAEVAAAVERGNARLNSNEQVKKFAIVGLAWEPGNEILTPTAKIRRRIVTAEYGEIIESLYAA